MTRLIDLSHDVEDGMITYAGLPAPKITDFLTREASAARYAAGTSFQIGRIDMVANTGTYVDAPSHRYAAGVDLAGLPLQSVAALPGLVVPAPPGRAIGADLFAGREVHGRAVLVHTEWSRHWRTEQYFSGHPYLTREAAGLLRDRGARLVGIDTYNIDDTEDGSRPAHSILLGAGIPVVEHMTGLDALPESGFLFFAVPVKVKGMGTFPVRAFALLD